MSAASCLLTEDQFLCSICEKVFTDPVSTPCGHNFCRTCITQYWDPNVQCQCPNCNEVFSTRPKLKVNTFISVMAAKFRQSAQQEASSTMCIEHKQPLELFCQTDQMFVCMLCTILDHRTHDVVPLKEEYEGKKGELVTTEAEIQQMIQEGEKKIKEFRKSVRLSNKNADREIEDGDKVFSALMETVEKSKDEFKDTIKEKQKETKKQAEGFIKELQREICELKKRSTEMEQLSQSEDHLHFLQSFLSLKEAPPTKDWTQVSVHPPSYVGTVVRSMNQLQEKLSKQMKKLFSEAELKKVQQYEVDVTLDPDTADDKLILSDDGKQVYIRDVERYLIHTPGFGNVLTVLSKQSFSSGRFYYEVQVKGKTNWDLGVARESINRKGQIILSPEDGFWTICLRNENKYDANVIPPVCLSLQSRPEKVGVFVDYEEGLVSFYDVHTAALIFSFTGCSFTEKLHAYFNPGPNHGGKNSAPLIISAVNHTE